MYKLTARRVVPVLLLGSLLIFGAQAALGARHARGATNRTGHSRKHHGAAHRHHGEKGALHRKHRRARHIHRHRSRHRRTATSNIPQSHIATAQALLIGDTTVESTKDYLVSGQAEAFHFRARLSGASDVMQLYLDPSSAASVLIVGIYSNVNGHAGSLLSTGMNLAPLAGMWNPVSVTSTQLVAQESYWLAILGQGGTLRYRDHRHGSCESETSAQATLSALPSLWRTGKTYADCPVSAYVTGSELISSESPTEPAVVAPANTAQPVISGSTADGQTLTASTGAWSGEPTAYGYQWQDCNSSGESCANVAGATASSYTLTSGDVGHTMRVVVTASNAGGSTAATSSSVGPVTAPPPTAGFTYSPSSPLIAQAVTFDASASSCPDGPCTYAWSDDGGPTQPSTTLWPLGNGQTLVYTFSEAGTKYVRLTVTDAAGQTATLEQNVVVTAESSSTEPPSTATPAPTNTEAPAISGIAQQGQTLKASAGAWTGEPTAYGYQWQDCNSSGGSCANVAGATASNYTLTSGDVGHTMRVVVTASNTGGSAPATSAATAVVVAESTPPPPTGMPAPLPAAGSSTCSTTVSSGSAASSAVSSAAAGTVVCLSAGSYTGLELSGTHSSDVTVQPVPGAKVTINPGVMDKHGNKVAVYVAQNSSHMIVHGFYVAGEVEIDQGSSFIRIDHNDISGGWEGVELQSEDCTVPHSPSWTGCQPMPPITDVTISGNRIHDIGGTTGDDALNINNWHRVRITGNEITHVLEGGNHTDCLQSTFGGTEITFDRNYEHDNQCQGFFLKDGDVTGALVYDNLFVRDRVENLSENNIQVFDTYNLVIRNNTNWSGNGDVLRGPDGTTYNATVDNNVSTMFNNGCCSESTFILTEAYNIFGQKPWTFAMASTDTVNASPQFSEPAADDYRLLNNPSGIGVDWRAADQQYGPTS